VSGTVRPQYMPDEPVTLQVFDWDDKPIAKFNYVHNFRTEDGVLWIAVENGKRVHAFAKGAWQSFEAGANNNQEEK
jgi:hypothetical protein